MLHPRLRFAVGVDGREGMVLGDRRAVRDAVHGSAGGEDDLGDAVAAHALQQGDAVPDVVGVIEARFRDGLGGLRVAGEVDYGVYGRILQDAVNGVVVTGVDAVEGHVLVDSGAVAPREVVDAEDVVAAVLERLHHDAADVAGGARDHDLRHFASLCCLWANAVWLSLGPAFPIIAVPGQITPSLWENAAAWTSPSSFRPTTRKLASALRSVPTPLPSTLTTPTAGSSSWRSTGALTARSA